MHHQMSDSARAYSQQSYPRSADVSRYFSSCKIPMGYTIKQKIDICLKAESNPEMTQFELAKWAQDTFHSDKQPSQTTISRILKSKNDLIASKQTDFQLVRRRKRLNPVLRQILTEWVTQSIWENIPITTPILQSTANAIWTRLPVDVKDGNGIFNQKWCNEFLKNLNINLVGNEDDIYNNLGYKLNKRWLLDEKLELKEYLATLIAKDGYKPQDIFTIDEFQLFYSLPLDQIFDINSVDKGLKQSSSLTENSLTIMLGVNFDGSERLTPLIVGKPDRFDVSKSSSNALKNIHHYGNVDNSYNSQLDFMNKITETYSIIYKNNINKWITSTMFQNYIFTLEHKIANNTPDRKIIIILDDSSTHRILNLKLNHIKLVYLKNNTNHKSALNSLSDGVNFDYCPMNFGVVHEFKCLYRLQQYLEMIGIQRKQHDLQTTGSTFGVNYEINSNSLTTDVLSESDYEVPLVKAIEWIKRAWDSCSEDKILQAWNKTHLIKPTRCWSNDQKLINKLQLLRGVEISKNYQNLLNVIKDLNVVIPWDVDDILGLVNERSKATLNYISIEEIVTSCLLESSSRANESNEAADNTEPPANDNWVFNQMFNISMNTLNDLPNMNVPSNMGSNTGSKAISPIQMTPSAISPPQRNDTPITQLPSIPLESHSRVLKHKLAEVESSDKKRNQIVTSPVTHLNDSLPSSSGSSPYIGPQLYSRVYSGITYKSASVGNLHSLGKSFNDKELLKLIAKLLDACKGGYVHLLKESVRELQTNYKVIQSREYTPIQPDVPVNTTHASTNNANTVQGTMETPAPSSQWGWIQTLKESAHPAALFCFYFFRLAPIFVYIFGNFFIGFVTKKNRFILHFIILILLVAADFWNLKNISGRLLVGLRWWNELSETSSGSFENVWVFETADPNRVINPIESKAFWTLLYIQPIVWAVLGVLAILKFQFLYLILIIITITLSLTNAIAFTRCDKFGKANDMATSLFTSTTGTLFSRFNPFS